MHPSRTTANPADIKNLPCKDRLHPTSRKNVSRRPQPHAAAFLRQSCFVQTPLGPVGDHPQIGLAIYLTVRRSVRCAPGVTDARRSMTCMHRTRFCPLAHLLQAAHKIRSSCRSRSSSAMACPGVAGIRSRPRSLKYTVALAAASTSDRQICPPRLATRLTISSSAARTRSSDMCNSSILCQYGTNGNLENSG